MTRVASFAQNQALLNELLRVNARTAQTQMQISTGKVAEDYKDIPRDTDVLLSAKRLETRTLQYQKSNKEIASRLDLQDLTLGQLSDSAQSLRQASLDAVSSGSGSGLMETADGIFQQAISLLNTTIDGKYIFGGTRADQPPVTVTSLAALAALPSVSQAFANSTQILSAETAPGQTMSYSFLADTIGTDLMTSLQRIAQFNVGPNGPFGGQLTTAQQQFLESEIPNLKAAADNLTSVVASNGQLQRQLEDTATMQDTTLTRVKSVISDIEDVDLASAVTRLNLDQTATEASAKILSMLGQTSLLDFL